MERMHCKYRTSSVSLDMDEEEKLMLSEARARLALTRRKKAKRKAREKLLDEARRKRAGINDYWRSRDRKRIHAIASYKISLMQDTLSATLQANDPEPLKIRPEMNLPKPKIQGLSDEVSKRSGVTLIRDELHINEGMEMHDSADMRRILVSGLRGLPQPRNEYQIVVQPAQEDNKEELEKAMEEDMSDRIAREEEESKSRWLKKRSKVLQRELPWPPAGSLDLINNSLIRAPTLNLIEQADEMIRKELLSLLEHDNEKYPLDGKLEKEKNIGSKPARPAIEEFDQSELKRVISQTNMLNMADQMIKKEESFLCQTMGHENVKLDEYVEAHKTCLNEMMYFPTRKAYGLSDAAGNMEKISAFQHEFEKVKKRIDDDTKKAQRLEQKINLLTNGYQMRAAKIWSQLETTLKQMYTAEIKYKCFQSLQRQEQLAASNRVRSIQEDVQKQKELEKLLQKRYGDLLIEQDGFVKATQHHRML